MSIHKRSSQSQFTTAPDGAVTATIPVATGAEATTTKSQSVAAAKTQRATQALTLPFGTIVPNANKFTFVETAYEPTDGLTVEAMMTLSDNDLLTACKKQFANTAKSYKPFKRDLGTLVKFFDAVVERFKDQGHNGTARNGRPTLPEAFVAIGWNYEAAKKTKQRFLADQDPIPTHARTPKPLQLTEGDLVTEQGKDGVYTVVNVHMPSPANTPTVDIVPEGDDKAKPRTITTGSLKKVTVPIKKIKVGDLILFDDNCTEYRYEGNGVLKRTEIPTVIQRKRERELAAIKAKKDRENAKAAEKAREKELRAAEAARSDLDKIAAAKAKKEAEGKSARGKSLAEKSTVTKSAKTELVKVARIGDTQKCGVYPESCWVYNTENAQLIGTQQVCEAERDRVNAMRASKAA